jgi:hypothetical protein
MRIMSRTQAADQAAPSPTTPAHGVKTPVAARLVGATYWRLVTAMRGGKITPLPAKDSSGDFIWTEADLERARQALAIDLRRTRSGQRGKAVAS